MIKIAFLAVCCETVLVPPEGQNNQVLEYQWPYVCCTASPSLWNIYQTSKPGLAEHCDQIPDEEICIFKEEFRRTHHDMLHAAVADFVLVRIHAVRRAREGKSHEVNVGRHRMDGVTLRLGKSDLSLGSAEEGSIDWECNCADCSCCPDTPRAGPCWSVRLKTTKRSG